jgi:hypothetical protein
MTCIVGNLMQLIQNEYGTISVPVTSRNQIPVMATAATNCESRWSLITTNVEK